MIILQAIRNVPYSSSSGRQAELPLRNMPNFKIDKSTYEFIYMDRELEWAHGESCSISSTSLISYNQRSVFIPRA
jgi:hypothetical protein